MGRNIHTILLLASVASAGCAMPSSLTITNPFQQKQNPNVANTKKASTKLGSPDPELTFANKLRDPVKTHLAYATWCEQAGNFQDAHKSYLKALEKSPKNAEAMLGLSRVDRQIGREAEADARLQKALKQHPKDPKVLIAVGEVHALRNQWPEALEKMQAAYEIDPFDRVNEYHLAVVEAKMGDLNSAMTHFTRSVGQAEAYYNIGYILKDQGRPVEAEKYLIDALKIKPDLKQAESTLTAMRGGKPKSQRNIQTASFDERSPQ